MLVRALSLLLYSNALSLTQSFCVYDVFMCLSIAKQYFVHTAEPLCVSVDDEDGDPTVCVFSFLSLSLSLSLSFLLINPSFFSHPFQDKDIAIVSLRSLCVCVYSYMCVCVCRPQSLPSSSVGGQQQESLLVFFSFCVFGFLFRFSLSMHWKHD